jgi:hypothetical protein
VHGQFLPSRRGKRQRRGREDVPLAVEVAAGGGPVVYAAMGS